MTRIPFEKQYLVDPVERIERDRADGTGVSGDALLFAIEWSLGHRLDDRLRKEVSKFSIAEVKRRGRRGRCKSLESFALEKAIARYYELLRERQREAKQRRSAAAGTVLAKAEPPPSELALIELQQEMKADFPNISWQALRNKLSAWISPKNFTDPQDVEDAIDRRILSLKS